MPYLHVDVLWTLTLPPGVTGFYQVSFRITASGYAQSAVYTDAVTNIVPRDDHHDGCRDDHDGHDVTRASR